MFLHCLIDHSAPQCLVTAALCPRCNQDWDPLGLWQVLEGELCKFGWSFTPLKGRRRKPPIGKVQPIGCLWDILQIKIEKLTQGLSFQRNPNCRQWQQKEATNYFCVVASELSVNHSLHIRCKTISGNIRQKRILNYMHFSSLLSYLSGLYITRNKKNLYLSSEEKSLKRDS